MKRRLAAAMLVLLAITRVGAGAEGGADARTQEAVARKETRAAARAAAAGSGMGVKGEAVLAGAKPELKGSGSNAPVHQIEFDKDAVFTGMIRGGQPTVRLKKCRLDFEGVWEGVDHPGVRNFIHLEGGSRFVFGPRARVNQQIDFINCRVHSVKGGGLEDIVELAPGFRAGYSRFPDPRTWEPGGFSVLSIDGATLITHRTDGLPSIHKKGGPAGVHSHHGVISFSRGEKNAWIVKGENQVYDGLVSWVNTLILRTETDLVLIGTATENAGCSFGPNGPGTLIKQGPGCLGLAGTQRYVPGVRMRIEEGDVIFHSDPGSRAKKADEDSPNLRLEITAGGRAGFHKQSTVDRIQCAGRVTVKTTALTVKGDVSFEPGGELELIGSRTKVAVEGRLRQGGRLLVSGDWAPGSYNVITAAAWEGAFELIGPPNRKAAYKDGVLTLE